MPRLILQSEGHVGEVYELTAERYRIGRLPDNDIAIEDRSIGGHHVELALDGTDYRLFDLDSTNGSRINGEKVKEIKLRRNDVIRIGNVEILYESEHAPDLLPLPDPTQPVNVGQCASRGRLANFKNLSPIPKQVARDKTPWKILTLVAVLIALGGVAFFLFKMFALAD